MRHTCLCTFGMTSLSPFEISRGCIIFLSTFLYLMDLNKNLITNPLWMLLFFLSSLHNFWYWAHASVKSCWNCEAQSMFSSCVIKHHVIKLYIIINSIFIKTNCFYTMIFWNSTKKKVWKENTVYSTTSEIKTTVSLL